MTLNYTVALPNTLYMLDVLLQAEVSKSEDKTYSSLSEVPGTMVERHAVEDERFTAAALYNLACSSTGVTSILDAAENAVVGEGCLTVDYKCALFLRGADELGQPLPYFNPNTLCWVPQ